MKHSKTSETRKNEIREKLFFLYIAEEKNFFTSFSLAFDTAWSFWRPEECWNKKGEEHENIFDIQLKNALQHKNTFKSNHKQILLV